MANTGGIGGTVTAIVTTATGSTVEVHFDDPPPGHDDAYPLPNDSPLLHRLEDDARPLKDVTVDENGNATSVKAHK